jgi:hypothetical protein
LTSCLLSLSSSRYSRLGILILVLVDVVEVWSSRVDACSRGLSLRSMSRSDNASGVRACRSMRRLSFDGLFVFVSMRRLSFDGLFVLVSMRRLSELVVRCLFRCEDFASLGLRVRSCLSSYRCMNGRVVVDRRCRRRIDGLFFVVVLSLSERAMVFVDLSLTKQYRRRVSRTEHTRRSLRVN